MQSRRARRPIAVLGSGYVGLVTAAVFAEVGHRVVGVDIDAARVGLLQQGRCPIHEQGLEATLRRHLAEGHLRFTTDTAEAVATCAIIFLAVGTPPAADGSADLAQVREAARAVARAARGHRVVVMKSTVPVGTGDRVGEWLREDAAQGATFDVLSNPEFLREGTALQDALEPDRIVIGAASAEAAKPLLALYEPFRCPLLVTDRRSAEMIKYAANVFLATKISFINALADLCEESGADIREVAAGIGADPRIGPHFLRAGLGYGGSCLPKDVDSLIAHARPLGAPCALLEAVRQVNAARVPRLIARMEPLLGGIRGKTIAVLGLTFKPDTDDLRESRALELCRRLREAGAVVRAHDPVNMAGAAGELAEITYCASPLEAAAGADATVLATEWPEYARLELPALRSRMHGDLLVDSRNLYDPACAERAGFRHLGIGHGPVPAEAR